MPLKSRPKRTSATHRRGLQRAPAFEALEPRTLANSPLPFIPLLDDGSSLLQALYGVPVMEHLARNARRRSPITGPFDLPAHLAAPLDASAGDPTAASSASWWAHAWVSGGPDDWKYGEPPLGAASAGLGGSASAGLADPTHGTVHASVHNNFTEAQAGASDGAGTCWGCA